MEEKKLKIAFLSIHYGAVDRGAETFVKELSERLSRKHKVDIIAGRSLPLPRWPLLWRFFLDPEGVKVFLFTIRNIGKIFNERYDVVIPIDGGWQALLVRACTLLYGGKMVISGQSGKGWFDRINILSSPNVFAPISTFSLKKLKWMNPLIKFQYIPNGVDLSKFTPSGKKLKIGFKGKVILCVGALVPSKRIELVIDAVSRIPDLNLLVAGSGREKKDLEHLGSELLGERFKLVSKKYEDMPQVYRSADVFALLPVKSEAFGNVYIEAMASGLPVVAPADAQRKEIVGEGGILVEHSHEPSDIAFAISEALKIKWGNKPREQAEKFSWDEIAQKYEKLFLEIIK